MRIGELYAGVGGLGQAAELAFDASTAWQLDLVGADVRRRLAIETALNPRQVGLFG